MYEHLTRNFKPHRSRMGVTMHIVYFFLDRLVQAVLDVSHSRDAVPLLD
jgi:hypothetical protein